MIVGRWAERQTARSGVVRRMFEEGRRLRAMHGDANVFDLSLGQPLDEPPAAVRAALQRVAAHRGRARFGYLPTLGLPAARERAAADVADERVTADCICITAGAGGALMVAIRTFVDAGDEVLGITPFFGEYPLYVEAIGATFVPVAANAEGMIDSVALSGALNPRTRAIILNTPNNPGGHTISAAEFAALATVLREHHRHTGREIIVMVDEVYHRLVYDGAVAPNALAAYGATVLARSYSKDFGVAGERIGYLAVHPDIAGPETMAAIGTCQRGLGFVHASSTMQHMLADLDDWTVDLPLHQRRRDHAVACARAAGLELIAPMGGLYLWVRSPWEDTESYVTALRERHVLTAQGAAFGVPTHLRLCFTASENAVESACAIAGEVIAATTAASS